MKKLITILMFILLASAGYGQLLAPNGIKYKGTLLTPTAAQFNYVYGVTSAIQTQFTGKVGVADTAGMLSKYARKYSPTFTGTVSLPSTSSIGNVSSTELGYLDNVTSAIQTQINSKVSLLPDTTGITNHYTLLITDAGRTIMANKASTINITIPLNSSVAFPVKTTINLVQAGAGILRFKVTGGVILKSKKDSIATGGIWSWAALYKRATDEWILYGDITD